MPGLNPMMPMNPMMMNRPMPISQRFDFPLEIQVHFKIKNIGFEKHQDKGKCRPIQSIMDGYRDYLEKFEVGGPAKRIPDETKKQKKYRLLKEKLLAH